MSHVLFTSCLRRALLVAALGGAGAVAWAQQPAGTPPPADPVEAPAGPAARPAPPRPAQRTPPVAPVDSASVTRMNGTIARWLMNPNGDVDGMLLADGTQVSFPPHLSARVTDAVKLKDGVQLTGWREGTVIRMASIQNGASGRIVRDDGPPAQPPAPRDPAALTALSASGRVDAVLRGPRGEVNGLVLQSGEQLRFPPHVGAQYAALTQRGAQLSARGFGTRNAFGTSFEATAIGESTGSLRQVFVAPRPPAGDGPVEPPVPAARPAS